MNNEELIWAAAAAAAIMTEQQNGARNANSLLTNKPLCGIYGPLFSAHNNFKSVANLHHWNFAVKMSSELPLCNKPNGKNCKYKFFFLDQSNV